MLLCVSMHCVHISKYAQPGWSNPMAQERCRLPQWHNRQKTPEEAARLIKDGMTVGMSGFTLAGEAKEVPIALAERAAEEPLSINFLTSASLGNGIDGKLTDAGVIARRMPFQVDATLQQAINEGRVMFIDGHLSRSEEHTSELQSRFELVCRL